MPLRRAQDKPTTSAALAALQAKHDQRARLVETTGHAGPYTPGEFFAFGGVSSPAPRPTPPEDVQAAQKLADEARVAFEAADREWQQAAVRQRAFSGGGLMPDRKAKKLTEEERNAWEARTEAAEDLHEPRIAYQKLHRAWCERRRRDEYLTTRALDPRERRKAERVAS